MSTLNKSKKFGIALLLQKTVEKDNKISTQEKFLIFIFIRL